MGYKGMRKQTLILICWVISIFGISVANALVGDPQAGKQKSAVCGACHGPDGNSFVGIWPKIAGQHEKYIAQQIQELKKGEKGKRFDPTMFPMIQGLNEQDIADLAAFYATQTMSLGQGSPEQELMSKGKNLYMAGNMNSGIAACAACHGPKGRGNGPANYPRLAGQHAEYTMQQLKKYQSGARATDPGEIMRDITKRMTEEEIQAVSHYIASLQ